MNLHLSTARLGAGVAVAVAAFAVAVPALASPAHARHATAAVKVTATEFKFVLSTKRVAHGSVTFTVVNKGKLAHDFKIAGKKTAMLAPGKSGKVTVTLKARKKYPYLCTVAGHAAAGMKGTLTVK